MTDATWLHFGPGSFFKALPAAVAQCPIVTVTRGAPRAGPYTLITLKANGAKERRTVSSIAEALSLDRDAERIRELLLSPELQAVSFTVTEKGYLPSPMWAFLRDALSKRTAPLALVSMDNLPANGDRLCEVIGIDRFAYPCTMVDKITPYSADPLAVEAEETQYLVIEDDFPNGRPPISGPGVYFTDRASVEKCERMKLCALLNPLHTALAVFGCLLGYAKISEEMNDPLLIRLLHRLGYDEALPTVDSPGIIDPAEFIGEVLTVRLPNPFLPDTPQRIACDTSQKLPIRFGEIVRRAKTPLVAVPLVFAGWLRYRDGVDDSGNTFELSPDPAFSQAAIDDLPLKAETAQYLAQMRRGIGAVRRTLEETL
jgi:fructuronate reductase